MGKDFDDLPRINGLAPVP